MARVEGRAGQWLGLGVAVAWVRGRVVARVGSRAVTMGRQWLWLEQGSG